MTFDRHGMALSILRIFIGIFFLAAGLNKLQCFGDTSLLARQLPIGFAPRQTAR